MLRQNVVVHTGKSRQMMTFRLASSFRDATRFFETRPNAALESRSRFDKYTSIPTHIYLAEHVKSVVQPHVLYCICIPTRVTSRSSRPVASKDGLSKSCIDLVIKTKTPAAQYRPAILKLAICTTTRHRVGRFKQTVCTSANYLLPLPPSYRPLSTSPPT